MYSPRPFFLTARFRVKRGWETEPIKVSVVIGTGADFQTRQVASTWNSVRASNKKGRFTGRTLGMVDGELSCQSCGC